MLDAVREGWKNVTHDPLTLVQKSSDWEFTWQPESTASGSDGVSPLGA
jgi:hypothetical protein